MVREPLAAALRLAVASRGKPQRAADLARVVVARRPVSRPIFVPGPLYAGLVLPDELSGPAAFIATVQAVGHHVLGHGPAAVAVVASGSVCTAPLDCARFIVTFIEWAAEHGREPDVRHLARRALGLTGRSPGQEVGT